jgi:hypothetical protein
VNETGPKIRTKNNNQNHHYRSGTGNELGNQVWTALKITARTHERQKTQRAENPLTIQQKKPLDLAAQKSKREKHEQHMTNAKSDFFIKIDQDSHNQPPPPLFDYWNTKFSS